jgi:hypothetical protein
MSTKIDLFHTNHANRPSPTRVSETGRCTHKARHKRNVFSTVRYTTPCILQLPKGSWIGNFKSIVGSFLQHIAIIHKISKVHDQYLQAIRDFKAEEIQCKIHFREVLGRNVRAIRYEL